MATGVLEVVLEDARDVVDVVDVEEARLVVEELRLVVEVEDERVDEEVLVDEEAVVVTLRHCEYQSLK